MKQKRVLVAPLDWGLGHAARCIPIIREVIEQGHRVIIAADGRAYHLLSAEFPAETIIRLKGYNPYYPAGRAMVFKMALQLPKFIRRIILEHVTLRKLINDYEIDLVISDNRYGLWAKQAPCILMTHQLFLRMPSHAKILQPLVTRLNRFFLSRYSQVWVPDAEGSENLSGSLSHKHKLPPNIKYIGILSRFQYYEVDKRYDLLVILSGPEPQRTKMEAIILKQLNGLSLKSLIVQGKTEIYERENISENTEVVSFLDSKKMNEAILSSELVISRSGFSNVMDLVSLNKNAVFIPTPGQTEQEYLAEYLSKQKRFHFQDQQDFDLSKALEKSKELNGNGRLHFRNNNLFKQALSEALEKI